MLELKDKVMKATSSLRAVNGFTLLEMTLTTALAALVVVSLISTLIQFNKHKLGAQLLINIQSQGQLANAQLLQDWQGLCRQGVVSGRAGQLQLMRLHYGRCTHYTYTLDGKTHSLKRRRLGGRYSSFLAQVQSLALQFGVDTDGDCQIDRWLSNYQPNPNVSLLQVMVAMELRSQVSRQLGRWQSSVGYWHEADQLLVHPVNTIWVLPRVC